MSADMYRVLTPIWHTALGRLCWPGEVVSLSHVPSEWLAQFVLDGLVVPEPGMAAVRTEGRIDLVDGVSDEEAALAGRALRKRRSLSTQENS